MKKEDVFRTAKDIIIIFFKWTFIILRAALAIFMAFLNVLLKILMKTKSKSGKVALKRKR